MGMFACVRACARACVCVFGFEVGVGFGYVGACVGGGVGEC
jgi:hypothetical protein